MAGNHLVPRRPPFRTLTLILLAQNIPRQKLKFNFIQQPGCFLLHKTNLEFSVHIERFISLFMLNKDNHKVCLFRHPFTILLFKWAHLQLNKLDILSERMHKDIALGVIWL